MRQSVEFAPSAALTTSEGSTRAAFVAGSLALGLMAAGSAQAQTSPAKVRVGVTPTEVYAQALIEDAEAMRLPEMRTDLMLRA